jgi:lysophospholipase L1-like esterase
MGEKFRILCYGDSNTWGYISGTDHQRHSKSERWTGVLQQMLGDKYEIIEEGLNSRTLISVDKRCGKEGRSGAEYLLPCLDSHDPIDLVIIMLGTNELKTEFYRNPKEIGEIFEEYFVKKILTRKSVCKKTYPKLLIVTPPEITKENPKFIGGIEKSQKLNEIYEDIAMRNDCEFMNNEDLEVGEDGVHLSRDGHRILASKLSRKVKEILK